jgi:hypothetical protein
MGSNSATATAPQTLWPAHWLTKFANAGYIEMNDTTITLCRLPTAAEIAAAYVRA